MILGFDCSTVTCGWAEFVLIERIKYEKSWIGFEYGGMWILYI